MSADTEGQVRGVIELADTLNPYTPHMLNVDYDEGYPGGMCWLVGPLGGPYYRGKTLASACKNWRAGYKRAANA